MTLEGRVVFAEPDLRYRTTGPMATGRLVELGSTAVIDADGLIVSVTSRSVTAVDEDCFVQFGMRARDFDLIVLRSKTHFRAVYEALAAEILIVDTPDYGPAVAAVPPRAARARLSLCRPGGLSGAGGRGRCRRGQGRQGFLVDAGTPLGYRAGQQHERPVPDARGLFLARFIGEDGKKSRE